MCEGPVHQIEGASEFKAEEILNPRVTAAFKHTEELTRVLAN